MAWEEFGAKRERGSVLRVLGPLAPEGVRRAVRMERVSEALSRTAARSSGRLPDGGFDPNFGASGRPSPMYEHPGGPRDARSRKVQLNRADYWGEQLGWSGTSTRLIVAQAKRHGFVYSLSVAPRGSATHRGGTNVVAEVALFVSAWAGNDPRKLPDEPKDAHVLRGSLNFLNARGYAVLVVSEIQTAWLEIAEVIQAAGVPFHLYALACSRRAAEEIVGLLFPCRWDCVKVKH